MLIIQAGLVNFDDVPEENHSILDDAALDNLYVEIIEGDESRVNMLDWDFMSRDEAIERLLHDGGHLVELVGYKEVKIEF